MTDTGTMASTMRRVTARASRCSALEREVVAALESFAGERVVCRVGVCASIRRPT